MESDEGRVKRLSSVYLAVHPSSHCHSHCHYHCSHWVQPMCVVTLARVVIVHAPTYYSDCGQFHAPMLEGYVDDSAMVHYPNPGSLAAYAAMEICARVVRLERVEWR